MWKLLIAIIVLGVGAAALWVNAGRAPGPVIVGGRHLPARQRDEARLTALAQLNASLPDEHFDCAARDAALARYLARLPFEDPRLDLEGARHELARRSLARAHRWRGEGCGVGKLSRP